jgi:hypothetical protein
MKRISICLFILTIITVKAFSQADFLPGYIITHEGDTLFGYVGYTSNSLHSEKCYFKKSIKDRKTIYKPLDISGYGYQGDITYVSKEVELEGKKYSVFLELFVKGEVSLYYSYMKNYRYFLIEKDSGDFIVLKDSIKLRTKYSENSNDLSNNNSLLYNENNIYEGTYKGILLRNFKNYPDIMSELEILKYCSKDLILLLEKYNNYTSPMSSQKIYKSHKSHELFFMGMGPALGYNYNLMKLNSSNLYYNKRSGKDNSTSFIFGLNSDIAFSPYTNKFFISFGLNLLKNEYKMTLKSKDLMPQYLHFTDESFDFMLTACYKYPGLRFQPYIGGGFLIHNTFKTKQVNDQNNTFYDFDNKNFFGYISGNIGLISKISDKFYIKSEISCFPSKTMIFLRYNNYIPELSSVNFTIGGMFKF